MKGESSHLCKLQMENKLQIAKADSVINVVCYLNIIQSELSPFMTMVPL